MTARKDDASKLRMDLLPVGAMKNIAGVLTFGAQRYGENNWRSGMLWSRFYGAALRHLTSWWSGEDVDQDSGLSHLAHAACCLMFLLEYMQTHPELDNRSW